MRVLYVFFYEVNMAIFSPFPNIKPRFFTDNTMQRYKIKIEKHNNALLLSYFFYLIIHILKQHKSIFRCIFYIEKQFKMYLLGKIKISL